MFFLHLDLSSALLRVHLLGHHVLSLFLLDFGFGSGLDLDRRRCRSRALHFFDNLVSPPSTRPLSELTVILREFCMRHPEVRDVCDIGQLLFFGSKWAWWFTAIMFVLNNTFIQVSNMASHNVQSSIKREVVSSIFLLGILA